jgi:hypothetical protein
MYAWGVPEIELDGLVGFAHRLRPDARAVAQHMENLKVTVHPVCVRRIRIELHRVSGAAMAASPLASPGTEQLPLPLA